MFYLCFFPPILAIYVRPANVNIYRTDLRQICTVSRTRVVDDQSEINFLARDAMHPRY